ncbi:MAG: acetyl-CoA carboxylase carboxyltransferase subunit alpha [Bacillota bacterium]
MANGITPLEFEKPLFELEKQIDELKKFAQEKQIDVHEEIANLEKKAANLRRNIFSNLSVWQRILIARHPKRPTCLDYINLVFDNFVELHGDRFFADDPAMVGGIAMLDGIPVSVVGQQKGRDTKDNLARNFGMPNPEGYRKAKRLMQQAEKFKRPIISLVDVAGAYPGIGAEERGQGLAIAENLYYMASLKVPVIVVITGEGGSGGALGIGVGDRILMLENAYYSVISPEGCASILWKDAARAQEAAETLRISARDLKEFGIIDDIIPEPLGGAHKNHQEMASILKRYLIENLTGLRIFNTEQLLAARYDKFRSMGRFIEETEGKKLKQHQREVVL